MDTNLSIELEGLPKRWSELDTLLKIASTHRSNQAEYDSICRSATVLICSHFEGAIKSLSKAIIKDTLEHGAFHSLPLAMQMRFVESVMLDNKSLDEGVKQSICTKLCDGKFSPSDSDVCSLFDHNSHITGKVIDKWGKYFGVRGLLHILKQSRLEEVFEGNSEELKRMLSTLESLAIRSASTFPYDFAFIENDDYRIFLSTNSSSSPGESMFSSFLEHIHKRRHDVAHGSVLTASAGQIELEKDILKMKFLLLGYTTAIGAGILKRNFQRPQEDLKE